MICMNFMFQGSLYEAYTEGELFRLLRFLGIVETPATSPDPKPPMTRDEENQLLRKATDKIEVATVALESVRPPIDQRIAVVELELRQAYAAIRNIQRERAQLRE